MPSGILLIGLALVAFFLVKKKEAPKAAPAAAEPDYSSHIRSEMGTGAPYQTLTGALSGTQSTLAQPAVESSLGMPTSPEEAPVVSNAGTLWGDLETAFTQAQATSTSQFLATLAGKSRGDV